MAEKPNPMPKVAQIPVPMAPRTPVKQQAAEYYDPETLRIVQADIDRRRKITELETDRDEWRRAALDAKQEINRLQMVAARDQKDFEEAVRKERADSFDALDRISRERDIYQAEVTRVRTCAENGAAIFLQILQGLNSGRPAEQIGQQAVADAVEPDDTRHVVAEPWPEPYPSVVNKGPRPGE